MSVETVSTPHAPAAIGPYAQAIVVPAGQRTVYCSGQIPLDPLTGGMVGDGDVRAEAEQVMRNLEAVLAAAGMGFHHVVRCTIYLLDLGAFSVVNEVYGACFGEHKPARATVQVAALPRGAKVEIDAIAVGP